MKIIGIYMILNLNDNKLYIGSAIDVKSRWSAHFSMLKNNKHHSCHLQNAWNLYGEESFKFYLIEKCKKEELIEREQRWLDYYQSYNDKRGYNINIKAESREGKFHTIITKEKISKAKKGIKLIDVMGEEKYEEYRRKISESRKGEKAPFYGKHLSDETKQKLREARLKQVFSKEAREKQGKWMRENRTGENNPVSKLTWEQIREIREKYIPFQYSQVNLAKEYGVSRGCIKNIVNNETWIIKEGEKNEQN